MSDDYKAYLHELLEIEEDLKGRYPEQEEGIELALAYALNKSKKYFNK